MANNSRARSNEQYLGKSNEGQTQNDMRTQAVQKQVINHYSREMLR